MVGRVPQEIRLHSPAEATDATPKFDVTAADACPDPYDFRVEDLGTHHAARWTE